MDLVQWYLLAAREAEEILALSRRCFIGGGGGAPPEGMTAPYRSDEMDGTSDGVKMDVEKINVEALSYFFERETRFSTNLRIALRKDPTHGQDAQRVIRHSPLWRRVRLKLEITADFYDAFVIHFPKVHCPHVEVRPSLQSMHAAAATVYFLL